MKSLIQEIRQQPEHIRHVFMWLMVVITFSLVGFVGFRSTSRQFTSFLNPEDVQAKALAEKSEPQRASPFATILNSWKDLRANISELLTGPDSGFDINNDIVAPAKELPPQNLPLSGDK